MEGSWEVLGRLWTLEAYTRRPEGSLGRLGSILGALEAMLEPFGGEKAPQMKPKTVPNRVPEATRSENAQTLIFDDGTQGFDDFAGPRPLLGAQNGLNMGCESHHRRRRRGLPRVRNAQAEFRPDDRKSESRDGPVRVRPAAFQPGARLFRDRAAHVPGQRVARVF